MMSILNLCHSDAVATRMIFGPDTTPVYVRLPDGTLRQVDGVEEGQIKTAAGPHDVVIIRVSEQTGQEA